MGANKKIAAEEEAISAQNAHQAAVDELVASEAEVVVCDEDIVETERARNFRRGEQAKRYEEKRHDELTWRLEHWEQEVYAALEGQSLIRRLRGNVDAVSMIVARSGVVVSA